MTSNSPKFGMGMKQSIVAFIIMIALIFIASDFNGQILLSQDNGDGGFNLAMAAQSGQTDAVTQSQTSGEVANFLGTDPIKHVTVFFPMISNSNPQTDTPAPDSQSSNPPLILTISSADQGENQGVPLDTQANIEEGKAWEDYPGPSVMPDIEIPAPMGILPHPDDQVNILLLGSDQRPYDGGFRTDTIQLLTINPRAGKVKLTSFPRDLYVYIPGYTVDRINTAFGWGEFESLAATMEYNFGVKPEYYVLINFWSFVDVIDSLGGITVEVGQDLCDHRNAWGMYCVLQGSTWMDGETALWYVRSRYTTSDLDRGRRQQEVLAAVFDQLISVNGLQEAPELFAIYEENVTTNLTFDKLAGFIPFAAKLADTREIDNYSIGEAQVYDWTNYYGAMVLLPIRESVLEVMQQVISQ